MAAKNPVGTGAPKVRPADPKETAKDLAETAAKQRIVDAHLLKLHGRNISGSQPRH